MLKENKEILEMLKDIREVEVETLNKEVIELDNLF